MSKLPFRQDSPEARNHQGSLFFHQGELEKAAESYQLAISMNSNYFQAYNNLGNVFFRQGRLDDAAICFQKALSVKSDYFGACYNLGLVCFQQGQLDIARKYYQQTISLNPDYYPAYNNLGNVYLQQGQPETASQCYQQALFLKPDHYEACNNLGNVFFHQGKLEEAEKCYEKALTLNPDPEVRERIHMHQGLLFLLTGRFAEGWKKYESRYHLPEFKYLKKIHPKWDGAAIPDKTLLVRYEQGFGDTIQFVRYLPLVKERCGKLIFICQHPLKRLLMGFPGIDQLLTKDVGRKLEPTLKYYTAIPLMSLPGIFKTTLNTIPADIPYIKADQTIAAEFRKQIPLGRFNVGLVWSGNPKYKQDRKRSIPLSEFAPLAKIPNIAFHSLQVGEQAKDVRDAPDGMVLYDWHDQLHDFADTAGLIANLDTVITVDTSVAHLAGAMGKPVWMLLPFVPDWRWLMNREDTPWYPTMRLFRQLRHGEWEAVIEQVAAELTRSHAERGNESKTLMVSKTLRVSETPNCKVGTSDLPLTFLNLKSCRYGSMLYIKNDMYIGRSLDVYGEFSEGEVALFRQLIDKGDVVVEAGANIGAHTVALAKIVGPGGKIIAYEPQRFIFQILCANAALNELPHVYARHAALGETPGTIHVPDLDYGQMNNFGGLALHPQECKNYIFAQTVPVETIDALNLNQLRLIKADAEGMELDILKGGEETIRRFRPVLYIENDRHEKSKRLIAFIQKLGYRLWWHIPKLFNPNNIARKKENLFGRIVSVNLLCLPKEAPVNINGMREVKGSGDHWR